MTTARRLFVNSPSPVFYLIVRKERGCYVFIAYPIPCLSIQAERHRRFPVQAVAHLSGGTLPHGHVPAHDLQTIRSENLLDSSRLGHCYSSRLCVQSAPLW